MPKNNQARIIIDTNLWVSFLISRSFQKLDPLLLSGSVRILFSIELFDEIRLTIAKPKLRKYFSGEAMDEMLSAFEEYIELVNVTSQVKECRDPKDDFLLSLSKDGNADFILTGDRDLLGLKTYGDTQIMTITDFLKGLGEGS